MKTTCSTVEAAQRLGVSVQTVQRWVDMGQLRAWKTLGGHRRIDVQSVDAMLHEQAVSLGGAPEALVPPAPTPVPAGTVRVLVVDDDAADRELLLLLSQRALPSATIESASNGFEALLSIGRAPPQILVTDIMMPHMNGFEMLNQLAASSVTRPVLIVATSSYGQGELSVFGRIPKGVVFMGKPINGEEFQSRLRQGAAAVGQPPQGATA